MSSSNPSILLKRNLLVTVETISLTGEKLPHLYNEVSPYYLNLVLSTDLGPRHRFISFLPFIGKSSPKI